MAFGFYDDRDWRVPHPKIGLSTLIILEEAVCAAWTLVRAQRRTGCDLASAHEDAITLELHEALFDRIFNGRVVDGFDSQLFLSVEREPKIRSYDRRHPDKMPDLLVRLVGRPPGIRNTQDGIFIECKPIDREHPVFRHYCENGLRRFIDGEYAWAMPTAMMVGYVKAGYSVSANLTGALRGSRFCTGDHSLPRPCRRSKASTASEVVHITQHGRAFRYLESDQVAPAIVIRHLWLKRE